MIWILWAIGGSIGLFTGLKLLGHLVSSQGNPLGRWIETGSPKKRRKG